MISSTTIPDDGVVGLHLEPFKFRTVAYKIKTEEKILKNKVSDPIVRVSQHVLSLNKEGWKDFHEGEDLQFEQVVLIIAKTTTRWNLNMMFVMNII